MTSQTFNYKEKFSVWSFLPAIAFAGVAIYCYSNNAGIAIKNFTLLNSPNSYYVTGGLAILFLAYALYQLSKSIKSKNNLKPITLTDTNMSFPKGSETAFLKYADVNELWVKDDSDDGESVILYTENNKNRFEFFAENFDNGSQYVSFKTTLENVCTNITNRD